MQPIFGRSLRKLLGKNDIKLLAATTSNYNVAMGYLTTNFYPK